MLFGKPLITVEFPDIEDFCRTWEEGIRVEYKQALATEHIAKVVSSFANTNGGIWIIGVQTDSNNRAVFPIQGFPNQRGIEERITQSCYQNLNPAVLPSIKIIPVQSIPGNIVVVVETLESAEAPHAIENSTKVYIRTNSTSQIIQLSDIDRIEYLLNRRRQPEQKREEMLADMEKRLLVAPPFIQITIAPRYPYRPILSGDVLAQRLESSRSDPNYNHIPLYTRRVRDGFLSREPVVAGSRTASFQLEVNLYGVMIYADALRVSVIANLDMIELVQIVIQIGRTLNLAKYLLVGITTNVLVRVSLDYIKDHAIAIGAPIDASRTWIQQHYSEENTVEGEIEVSFEKLNDDLQFIDYVVDLVEPLTWSFNWAERSLIAERTHQILQANQLP
jgi:hypothetical protein